MGTRPPAPHAEGPARPRNICPQCQGRLDRVPRGVFDRVLSLFVPLRRYRCRSARCGWEGLLRRSAAPADAEDGRVYAFEPSRQGPATPSEPKTGPGRG
jgi:hypothetical protein